MEYVGQIPKDPTAVLDFGVSWADWLATGETITVSTWALTAGITEDSESETGTVATIWLSGGTAGEDYDAANSITTSDAREDKRTVLVMCRER